MDAVGRICRNADRLRYAREDFVQSDVCVRIFVGRGLHAFEYEVEFPAHPLFVGHIQKKWLGDDKFCARILDFLRDGSVAFGKGFGVEV